MGRSCLPFRLTMNCMILSSRGVWLFTASLNLFSKLASSSLSMACAIFMLLSLSRRSHAVPLYHDNLPSYHFSFRDEGNKIGGRKVTAKDVGRTILALSKYFQGSKLFPGRSNLY